MESPERLKLSLAKALLFIEEGRNADGLWSDFLTLAGESTCWVSSYVGYALARFRAADGGTWLRDVGEKVLACQSPEGGWGYGPVVPPDADSTSWCIIFLSALGLLNEEARAKAEAFLLRHQSPENGGFRTYSIPRVIGRFMSLEEGVSFAGWSSSQACVTAASARALMKTGAAHEAGRAVAYVRKTQAEDGHWDAYWWTDNLYSTVLCQEVLVDNGDAASLERAEEWISRTQLPDGSWGPTASSPGGGWAFSTALALSGLMLGPGAKARGAALERGVMWLLAHQSPDGGWESRHILRIPHPSTRDPWTQVGWREDGKAIGAVIRDQRRLYTTATVFTALSRLERLLEAERDDS